MLEAFERHLKTIDINGKFENAKTNDDKIAIAKSFLEDNGYYVGKPKKKSGRADDLDPYAWKDPYSSNRISTYGSGRDVVSTKYIMDDRLKQDILRNGLDIQRHVIDRMGLPLAEEILKSDKCTFEQFRNVGDMGTTYKVKVGIFLP